MSVITTYFLLRIITFKYFSAIGLTLKTRRPRPTLTLSQPPSSPCSRWDVHLPPQRRSSRNTQDHFEFPEQERLLSAFLIRESDLSACLLSPSGFADNPSISRRSSPCRLKSNFIFFQASCCRFPLTALSSSDSDRRGLERSHVPRYRVAGRRPPRHVLVCLLHRPHALRKLYPRWHFWLLKFEASSFLKIACP